MMRKTSPPTDQTPKTLATLPQLSTASFPSASSNNHAQGGNSSTATASASASASASSSVGVGNLFDSLLP